MATEDELKKALKAFKTRLKLTRLDDESGGLASAGHETLNRALLLALIVAILYFVGAKIGLALTFSPFPLAVLWPPNAIVFGALLLAPTRWWWVLLLAVLPAHLFAEVQESVPVSMVLCWYVADRYPSSGESGENIVVDQGSAHAFLMSFGIDDRMMAEDSVASGKGLGSGLGFWHKQRASVVVGPRTAAIFIQLGSTSKRISHRGN